MAITIALLALGLAVVHSNAFQQRLIRALVDSIDETTGWLIEIEDPRARLWPARFIADGITISTRERPILTIEHLEAHWSWAAVLGTPIRVDDVAIHGLAFDLSEPIELPTTEPAEDGAAVDPWRVVEIGRLQVTDGRGAARVLDILGQIDGLRTEVTLADGIAGVDLSAERLQLDRSDRRLELGPVVLRAHGSAEGVVVDDLELGEGDLALRGRGEFSPAGGGSGSASFRVRSELEDALAWWDPNLVSGLDPAGVLDLEATVGFSLDGEVEVSAVHRGHRLVIAGYALDELELGLSRGIPRIRAAGSPWGSATVSVDDPGIATVHAQLDDAPVERVLAFVAPQTAMLLDGPVSLTGVIDGTVSYPFSLETLSGRLDLEVDTPKGRAFLKAHGAVDAWQVTEALVDLPGVSIAGQGSIVPGGAVDANLDLRVDDGQTMVRLINEWIPDLGVPRLEGGPLTGRINASGTLRQPRYDAELEWKSPVIMATELGSITAQVDGNLASVDFVSTIAADGMEIVAEGSAGIEDFRVNGGWTVKLDNLHRVFALAGGAPESSGDLTGSLTGDGAFALDEGGWSVDGSILGADVGVGEWRSRELALSFRVDPDMLEIAKLTVSAFGGSVVGSGRMALEMLDSELALNLEWREIDLARAPADVIAIAKGTVSGSVDLDGTVSHPSGRVEFEWRPDEANSAIPKLRLAGALDDGVLSIITEEVSTEAGSLWAQGEVSIGMIPRPEWLWPEAPDEAVRLSARGHQFHSDAIVDLLGLERPPINATGDLDLEATWHPTRPEDARVFAEVRDLRLHHVGGELVAEGPVVVRVTNERAEIEPVTITGRQTYILMSGGADLKTGELDGSLDAILDPAFARNIPYPVQIHEPIAVAARLRGTLESPRIGLDVNHPGGALVFRDPPLRIRDLVLSAELVDGVLWINDGRARVNQGTMEIGGGWDPMSGQGIVAEFDSVVVFVGGILSQWSGAVAVEPEPDRLAKVAGELNLIAGLWDQNVSLGGAIFGSQSLEPARDDPLNEIFLDLDVRGRGVVRVENNLGRFDARWDVLRVTGSAARPRLTGEISIAPGGQFTLAGQRVKVRRGGLLFTGDPDVDPIVEIVPETDLAVFGGDGGPAFTSAMATQGLVSGLAGALGFENETLQPAEISVETEKDASSNFMLGQRLSHNVALFFATNTTDVQDQTSMLQFWNLPGLKGLAIQGYQKTLTEELGGNVIQRFQWGGSSLYDDRLTIRKLKLNGEWPISKRGLRKSTGFRRGQPFDPFLEFVARVRMERALAAAGYQEARVAAEAVKRNNAWTLNFECEPGPRQEIVFSGDEPPRRIRDEVTALYRHPPLESFGFQNMSALLDRYYDVEGYPDASIVVERRGESVVAEISRRGLIRLTGPILEGVPAAVSDAVIRRLGRPSELALLAGDEERAIGIIERVLADQGYRQADVLSVGTVATSAEQAEIRAVVELGPQTTVGRLIVNGSDPLGLISAEDFSLRVGRPLDRLSVDLAASELRAGYDAAGYSDAMVRGSAESSPDGEWVVTLQIEPGIQRILEGIEVTGLKHTRPSAIVSGVSIEEGEILRNSDLDATAVRVANFAPIERVDVRTVPQGSNGAKVEIDVFEKPRWTTEVGGGWSSERGVQARFGVRDDNLIGRGFGLNLRGRWDQTEWLGFVVASLPPLPGKKLSFSSTIGYSRGEAPQSPELLAQDEASWSIEATRRIGNGRRNAIGAVTGDSGQQITAYYRYTTIHTYEKVPDPDAPVTIDWTSRIGLIGARFVRDRFDYAFDPKSGHGLLLDVGYSNEVLGSDLDYWTGLGNASVAWGVFGSSTWIQSLRIGVAEPLHGYNLEPEVRFFAGGQGSVRGFDRDTVGPSVLGGPVGGGALLILNEELRIPVWGGLRAAVFADIGQVWASWGQADIHMSVGVGVGVRWATPVGPLWADIAWPVVNTGISSTKPKFYIGIGRPF
jgi:outer membrane protein assembly factor BamA